MAQLLGEITNGNAVSTGVSARPLRIALIGNGGIANSLYDALAEMGHPESEIVALLVRDRASAEGWKAPIAVTGIEELLAAEPDVVVECAGHSAVADFGERILLGGKTLIIVSAGALADETLRTKLEMAARAGGSRLILAAGAMAGVEALSAARIGGLSLVRYTGRKPPLAWRGTPAEGMIDLTAVDVPTVFYRGNAREAALLFPKNSNVAATIALAGVGFEETEVELVADPTAPRNVHELTFDGEDGRAEIMINGAPSKVNPKTSVLTSHSIARLLNGMTAKIVV